MKMLRVIPRLEKGAEEGSYFHDRRNDGTRRAICLGTKCLLTNCLLDKEEDVDYSPVNYSFANCLGGEWRKVQPLPPLHGGE